LISKEDDNVSDAVADIHAIWGRNLNLMLMK
jgi:hypothetical protein